MRRFQIQYDSDNCGVIPDSFVPFKIGGIITNNEKMAERIYIAQRVAQSEASVLITGESGVGKELLSELIHKSSTRSANPYIKINCAAIPDSLKEAEFFGYEPGAFSGAARNGKKGLIEAAQNGTLFMDEVGEMPLDLQSVLLRVMQDGVFVRVGGIREIKSNARIICATNRDLKELVEREHFRNDLYFRLNVISINIPPLRNRREDIPLLSLYFVEQFNQLYNAQKKLSREVLETLSNFDWLGNIRELKNTIERIVLIAANEIIVLDDLKYIEAACGKKNYVYFANQEVVDESVDRPLKAAVEKFELELIKRTIHKHGSLRKAAKALDTAPSTLSRKLSKDNED